MRTVQEWIGANDDSAIPASCKLRIWNKANGRCVECGRRSPKLTYGRFHIDHIVALCNGENGNRESNLQLLCLPHHKAKTAVDVAEKSKVNRVRKKHLGFTAPKRKIASRPFAKAEPQRTASRPLKEKSSVI